MFARNIIVIGASSGGVEALQELVRGLPPDLPATVFIVLHTAPHAPSFMPEILSRAGPLPALTPKDGERIQQGRIYVAPPDHHLLIDDALMRVAHGPKENRHRPAVDPLFRSAACAYGPRVVGVVLTGNLDDGTAGLLAVKKCGGLAIVQHPQEASFPGMPGSAMKHVRVDYCLPLAEIAPLLERLARDPAEEEKMPMTNEIEIENKIAQGEINIAESVEKLGTPSAFTCPECHSVMYRLKDMELIRFRCQMGHAFSTESLHVGQTEAVEDRLWDALRALEENTALTKQLAALEREQHRCGAAALFEEAARRREQQASVIQQMLLKNEKPA